MNILECNINSQGEKNLEALFYIKEVKKSRLLEFEKNSTKNFLDLLFNDLQNQYRTQFYVIFNHIVFKEKIFERNLILDYLKNIDSYKIYEISQSDFLTKQVLKKFQGLADSELRKLLDELIIYLSDKEINYEEFYEKIKFNIINFDDNIISKMKEGKCDSYYSKNINNEVEDILYVYDNGLIICFCDLLTYKRNYVIKYIDETSIRYIKSFQEILATCKIKAVYWILEKYSEVIPDYFIEYANEKFDCWNHSVSYYIWAEKQGIKNMRTNYELAKMYSQYSVLKNTDKAIALFEKALESGVSEAQIELNKIKNNGESEVEESENKILNDYIQRYMNITKKKCIEISFKDIELINEPLKSKIGGNPYMPNLEEWPKDRKNKYMALLLQINFEDIKFEGYPDTGILQVFVSTTSFDLKDYSIKYHKDISKESIKEYPIIDVSSFIIEKSCEIKFNEAIDYIPCCDSRCEDIVESFVIELMNDSEKLNELRPFLEKEFYKEENDKLKALIFRKIQKEVPFVSAAIGGYTDFYQIDPMDYEKKSECLLKLDCGDDGKKKFDMEWDIKLNILFSKNDLKEWNIENAVLVGDCT